MKPLANQTVVIGENVKLTTDIMSEEVPLVHWIKFNRTNYDADDYKVFTQVALVRHLDINVVQGILVGVEFFF